MLNVFVTALCPSHTPQLIQNGNIKDTVAAWERGMQALLRFDNVLFLKLSDGYSGIGFIPFF